MWYYNGSELEDGTDLGVLFYRENSEGLLFVCPSRKFYMNDDCLVWINKTGCTKTDLKVKFRVINGFGVCKYYNYEDFLGVLRGGKLKVGLSPKFAGTMVNGLEAFLDSNFEVDGHWYQFESVNKLCIYIKNIEKAGYSLIKFFDSCSNIEGAVTLKCKYEKDEFLRRFAKFQIGNKSNYSIRIAEC